MGAFVELVKEYGSFTTAYYACMSYGYKSNFKDYVYSFSLRQLRNYCHLGVRYGTVEMVNLILDVFDMHLRND